MIRPTRRAVLHGALGIYASGAVVRPYIANAAATTATMWWAQGFAQEEDISLKKIVADYEKASGNRIDLSIIPFAPERQKIISAMTSGAVPDLFDANPPEIAALYAWDDRLVDVSDVVETQKAQFSETALLSASCYNNVTKARRIYGVPIVAAAFINHVWRPLVEKAGFKIEDIPDTWDAYYDFFKEVHKQLRAKGERRVYGIGFQVTTNGVDPNALFNYFLIAYGGENVVTKDGKLHADDPQVREAVIKTLNYITTAYKGGFVPPSAINWNDADDNNAFHAKTIVMDLDGTISTEVAIIKDKENYDNIVTMSLPRSNEGKQVPSQLISVNAVIPKGAKGVDPAKEFLKYLIQPEVTNEWLKTGLGRNAPPMPSIVKNDPWWQADPHRKAYVDQAVLGPTVPAYWAFNPAYAQVQTEHVWSGGWMDIIINGMKPEAAADKALKRVAAIFEKYPIPQS